MHINISRLSKPEPLEKSMQSSLVKAFQLELTGLRTIEPTVVLSEKMSALCERLPPSALTTAAAHFDNMCSRRMAVISSELRLYSCMLAHSFCMLTPP